MSEENRKSERIVPGQVVFGNDTSIDLNQTLDSSFPSSHGHEEEIRSEGHDNETGKNNSQKISIKPGEIIDNRYRLLHMAGSGATGQVWRAFDMNMGFEVAIKLISPTLQKIPEVFERFRESFKTVHNLHHRYICPLNHMGNDERFGWYLVMQWMPETLTHFCESLKMRKETMSLDMIQAIIAMLAEGLDYVHELQIIHRDIKPANIVILRNKTGDFSTAQLIDFGLSQEFENSHMDTFVSGTPTYMAPEQWINSVQDGKTDQYALAMVAYELYCGHPAFTSSSFDHMKNVVLNVAPDPIPDLPPYVNQALLKALSKNREDRFNTCTDFARALSPPPKFYQRHMVSIISATVSALCIGGFFLFNFLHNSTYTQQVLTYSSIERDLTFGKLEERLSFLLTRDEHRIPNENDTTVLSPPDSGNAIPRLMIDQQEVELTKETHGKGWSCSAQAKDGVTLTLSGYSGGNIKASQLNLNILLAKESKNLIKTKPNQAGIELHDGHLTISGATDHSGELFIACGENQDKNAKTILSTSAIIVSGKNKNFNLKHFNSLTIETDVGMHGIFVQEGNLSCEQVSNILIHCKSVQDAIVAGNMSIVARNTDHYELDGGLFLSGSLSVFNAKKPQVRISQIPFVFKLCNISIHSLVQTEDELVSVMELVSVESPHVALVTDHIETGLRKNSLGNSISTIPVARGRHILLSVGNKTIRKGPNHLRGEELFCVQGNLTLGFETKMGASTLTLDGGCKRVQDGTEPIKFTSEDGRTMNIARYKVNDTSTSALVSVYGSLIMNDNVVIKNNVNSAHEFEKYGKNYNFRRTSGGVFVANNGLFEMWGGCIQNCEAPYGGGVCVQGKFVLKDGAICENTANNGNGTYSSEGGGVSVINGTFEMIGGAIFDNLAICSSSSANGLNCAKGAGIHLGSEAKGILSGGIIHDNHSLWGGGGIYVGGSGSSELNVSENIRIENNTAIVGAGIFMNASVHFSGGTMSKNSLLKGPSATMPAGSGVYFLPNDLSSTQLYPCLFLSGDVSFSPDNHIFISSVNRSKIKDPLVFDERFFPINLSGPLTGNPKVQHFTIDGGTFIFPEGNEVPLVGLRFIKEKNNEILESMQNRFSFGFLGVPQNTNFQLIPSTIKLKDVTTGKVREEYCLSVTPK